MSAYSSDRLLIRPLRRDRLFQLWVVALLAIALWNLPTYLEWGGAPNLGRALGLLGLLIRVGFWLWLLLLIVPAFLRRGVRRCSRRRGAGWWHGFWRASWWRGGSWSWRRSGARRPTPAWQGGSPVAFGSWHGGAHAPGVWPTVGPPVFRSVHVQPRAVLSGHPVTVTWEAPLAEQVAVGNLTGLPPAGSIELVPIRSGPLTLTAVNSYGTDSASTEQVVVQSTPRIDLSSVPLPPQVPSATTAPAPPPPAAAAVRRLRLDDVVDRQRTRRAAAPRPLAPGAAPRPLAPGAAPPAAPSLPNLPTDPASRRPS